MRSIVAKIAFAVIVLSLLTLIFGITKDESPTDSTLAAPISSNERISTSGFSSQ